MIKSLRWRLQIWHAVILTVVLTLFGGYGYALQWQSRIQQVDDELDRTAGIVISRLGRGFGIPRMFRRQRNDGEQNPRRGNDNGPPELERPADNKENGARNVTFVDGKASRAFVSLASVDNSSSAEAVKPAEANETRVSQTTDDEPARAEPAARLETQQEKSGNLRNGEDEPEENQNEREAGQDENTERGDGEPRERRNGRIIRLGRGWNRDWQRNWRGVEITEDLLNPPEESTSSPIYFAIWSGNGELLEKSKWAPELEFPDLHFESDRLPTRSTRQRGENREVIHVAAFNLNVLVGRSLVDEIAAQRQFLLLLIAAGLTVLVVGILGGWWLTSRAIQPITSMSRTASSISVQNLDARIDVRETDTELGQLATVLNQTFDRLQSAFEQQVRFTADASHELRTPVAILLAQTQTALSKTRSDEDYRSALESCRRAALRMKSLTESLLALARFDGSAGVNEFTSVDLRASVEEAIELLKPLADEHEITVELHGESCLMNGDADQLVQLMLNLLSNAIRYNRPRGKVDVSIEKKDDQAIVTIADTGVGIDTADIPHLFERFFRVDKTRSRELGGSGLGLSISKSITQAHGGDIQIESTPDVGTRITIAFPALPATDRQLEPAVNRG